MWAMGRKFRDHDCSAFNKCDGMCCNDPWCFEDDDDHDFIHDNRFLFCVCWDRLRRCWVNPRTGLCVDIESLRL
jgi:hypothetical protein